MRGGERKTHACGRLSQQEHVEKIAGLNDALRELGRGGRILVAAGIAALGEEQARGVLLMVGAFDAFTEDNDPYDERDLGILTIGDDRILWKIDLYEEGEVKGSSKPPVELRVLTIMLASEY